MHLAMWSGPRNISTAMMRAFENRADTRVMDEPFYAAYLHDSGLDHPVRSHILEHQETDWRKVIELCTSELPEGVSLSYQKQMTHHMLEHYDTNWLHGMRHCFLLREPARVLASYEKKREQPTLSDIGLAQQVNLFEKISAQAIVKPLIIDSADFLQQPRAYLEHLCEYIELPFTTRMLSWPAGKRDSDGVWAEHWYNRVWESTGFEEPKHTTVKLASHLQDVCDEAQPLYERLFEQRLQIG
ncbi:MAG: HAD family hydrolase [Gammaproteobacteria bacterium]